MYQRDCFFCTEDAFFDVLIIVSKDDIEYGGRKMSVCKKHMKELGITLNLSDGNGNYGENFNPYGMNDFLGEEEE